MSARIKDGSAADELKIEAAYRGARAVLYPQDALGEYRVAEFSGLTTVLAANGEVFQFRWTDASNLCALRSLRVRAAVITGFTAAQELAFTASQVTSWSADGSGGTTITPGATNLLKRNSYPQSKVGSCRIATTGVLTAGTKTIFGNPFLVGQGKTLAAAATVQDAAIEAEVNWHATQSGPIVFGQNEGFVVRNNILLGAAGTVRWAIQAEWAEFLNADFPTM